jgi:hypothetical protein
MNSETRIFLAGPLAFRLDAGTGFVRDIRFHGHEILRGIYPAVRDEDWATLVPETEAPEVHAIPDGVRLRLEARVRAAQMDLTWTAEIEAHASGQMSYRWRGQAVGNSTTNRTGLCVLHPAEIAGAPCVVEHTGGQCEAGWFPQAISPHQPFRDLRAITHVIGRAEVAVRLEGEVFEMEDQRNWTDASFKTYCRPLDWPRPYRLASGEKIEHVVTVNVRGEMPPFPVATPRVETVTRRLPRLGFTLPAPIPAALRERVRALHPNHVRVDTTPDSLERTLSWACMDADFLDCALILAIRGSAAPGDRQLFPKKCVVHLFDPEGNAAPAPMLEAWQRAGFDQIATGTLHHFTELNRKRPSADGAHALTVFGINAQCHASDNDSILESISQHAAVARAAYRIGGGRPLAVGPISLGRTASSADARLRGEFGARWLRGSLSELAAVECVESTTYFHAHGPAGFLREECETPVECLLRAIATSGALPP